MSWKNLFRRSEKRPQDGDRQVLAALVEAGADLSEPRDLVHYLYVPTEQAAQDAAAELRGLGYTAEAQAAAGAGPGDQNPWLVLANVDAVVDEERIGQERARFEELARTHGGEYDGWEAAV